MCLDSRYNLIHPLEALMWTIHVNSVWTVNRS